jgi:hypothetical protein
VEEDYSPGCRGRGGREVIVAGCAPGGGDG